MRLDEGFRALAASMAEEAPRRVELELRRAFRQRVRRRRAIWGAAIGAMAAGLAVAPFIFRPEVGPPAFRAARIEVPDVPEAARIAPDGRTPAPGLARTRRRNRPAPRESARAVTGFYALAGADGPFESGALVRVELPRSAVQFVGLPVNESRRSERIQADVLLGQDGIARAIRFVQ